MRLVYITMLLLASTYSVVNGQKTLTDSFRKLLEQSREDTSRTLLLVQLSNTYLFYQPDSAIMLVQQAIQTARRLQFAKGEAHGLNVLGSLLRLRGDLPQALESHFRALEISRAIHDEREEASGLAFIGAIYLQLSEYRQAILYFQQALQINDSRQSIVVLAWSNIGEAYEKMNMLDSALFFQQKAYEMLKGLPRGTRQSLIPMRLGIIQGKLGNNKSALNYYQDALSNAVVIGDMLNRTRSQYQIAELYNSLNQPDSSLYYAHLAFINGGLTTQATQLSASTLLVKLYQARKQLDSAFYYQQIASGIKDSLFGPEKFQKLQLLTLNEQQRVQQLQEEQERSKTRARLIGLLLISGVFLLILLLLWRTTRQQQRANRTLNEKNNQIEKQRNELAQTLTELKSAQAQLVQQEKMASLGELTAGIAHEIQNPLNFVNNFSEVNLEMNHELKEKLSGLTIDVNTKEEIQEILKSIETNEQKIIHHGKRADAIVKGMLQHSRTSIGQKESTDINALVDEYFRLSYHGFRAKDKNFNATMLTNFDPTLSQTDIIPQDIGRVLLNLINNAFYAVSEKKKLKTETYKPTVSIETKKINNKVQIKIVDNGMGIPQSILDKIFQPFFTTKPTGQGTGLGLSMSYDIIKAHGGELKVESNDGNGAEFIVQIPV